MFNFSISVTSRKMLLIVYRVYLTMNQKQLQNI